MDEDDPGDSTLLRSGKIAFRLADMAAFSANLAARPIERLVADLPALLTLPDGKYGIVALAIAKRMRTSDAERASLQGKLRGLESKADGVVRERCQALLKTAG
jgi:hypothetical protein